MDRQLVIKAQEGDRAAFAELALASVDELDLSADAPCDETTPE